MIVERAVLREVPLALARPFRSSAGVVSERRVLLLTLHAGGLESWSECVAPAAPTYTYETVETAWLLLTGLILPAALGVDVEDREAVARVYAHVRGHPMAKATLEMAALGLVARGRGVSLRELLGGTRDAVPVGVSVGMAATTEELGDLVERHLADGYRRVKVKVGPGRDVDVLASLRERFPDIELWADANSAYTLRDADHLQRLDALGLGLLEEPLEPGAFLDHARLQERLETPICLDESVGSEADAELALELGSCRIVNLKPGRVGGLAEAVRVHDLLNGAGMPAWCGGMLETGIGRAYNLALASLPGFVLPGDISASRRYWERDLISPELVVSDGEMVVPAGPGIGVEVDAERIEALTVRRADFS